MEVLKNNRLIADFMGFEMVVENYHGINIIKSPNDITYDLNGLKYHKSWDWLMSVVEKIEDGMSDNYQEFRVVIFEDVVHIVQKYKNGILLKDFEVIVEIDADGSTKIENTYKAVVEFINWYNKKLKIMTEESFDEKYTPIQNHIDADASWGGTLFETYGDELGHVLNVSNETPKKVWTLVEGDDEKMFIIAGCHVLNRIGYLITEEDWVTGKEQILVDTEIDG